ncbi:transcriptional regulator, partial [Streptomyces sp. NPDC006386]
MSTDYQQAREALGRRLRELRLSTPEGRLTGTQL